MNELIQISKYAGMREDLIQAGGGNTSIKLDEHKMAIKSSGIQLADLSENYGYSVVDYQKIKNYMDHIIKGQNDKTENHILKESLIEGRKPSIETFLHAITGRVTLHTHSVAVNILTARKGGMKILKQLFPNSLIIDYATPGLKLAELYYRTYLEESEKAGIGFSVIFLKNHGVIVSGKTAQDVIQIMEDVLYKTEKEVGINNQAYHRGYELYQKMNEYGIDDEKIVVKAENFFVLEAYKKHGNSLWNYQFCPDCIVFCGKKEFVYDAASKREDLQHFIQDNGNPVLVSYGNDLFIRAESVRKAREIESVLAFSAQVALFNENHLLDLLSDEEQNFLLNWDAEKYRQKMQG